LAVVTATRFTRFTSPRAPVVLRALLRFRVVDFRPAVFRPRVELERLVEERLADDRLAVVFLRVLLAGRLRALVPERFLAPDRVEPRLRVDFLRAAIVFISCFGGLLPSARKNRAQRLPTTALRTVYDEC
jgi:hypothetical protein